MAVLKNILDETRNGSLKYIHLDEMGLKEVPQELCNLSITLKIHHK